MSWYSKETATIFDQQPIPGLFYLDGDQYSRVLERDSTAGMKYPKISFPSGRSYEVYRMGENELRLHLFGAVSVPIFADRDAAFRQLNTLIAQPDYVAYFVHPVDINGVLIWGQTERERLLVTYNHALQLVEDVQGVTGSVGAYRVNGHTYHLP